MIVLDASVMIAVLDGSDPHFPAAKELLAAVRPYVAGVQVSAPFGNVETAIAVMR